MLGRLIELVEEMQFELIPLEEAAADTAYAAGWEVPDKYGLTLLEQGMQAKGQAFPPIERKPYERLRELCR